MARPKKIPDIEHVSAMLRADDTHVVITLRGIGEMIGDRTSPDPQNRIRLDLLGAQGSFDFGQPRALVRLEAQPKDATDPRGTKDVPRDERPGAAIEKRSADGLDVGEVKAHEKLVRAARSPARRHGRGGKVPANGDRASHRRR